MLYIILIVTISMFTPYLTNILSNDHILLLYSSDDERNNAPVNILITD
jgi:hypothetical protein